MIVSGPHPSRLHHLSTKKKQTSLWQWVSRGAFALLVSLSFFLFYILLTLPSLDTVGTKNITESTKILDRNGFVLYTIHGGTNRTNIELSDVPAYLPNAFIAIEDVQFYHHFGFNPVTMILWPLEWLFPGKQARGGSTITQQLVKNLLLSPERTALRKIRELFLAIGVEWKFSKEEILTMYLNQIPFGSNSSGVQEAAKTFFGKKASELTVAEAATLAAIPKAPTYYSPYGDHPDKLLQRRNIILGQMKELGFITDTQYNEAKDTPIDVIPYSEEILAPHFVMYVVEELEKKYGRETLERSGYRVYTTLDLKTQQIAEKSVQNSIAKNSKKYDVSNAALVAQDPKNGHILAMVGSVNYFDTEHDGNVNVSIAERQPGSSFKPFVYALAFMKGFSPATVVFDVETDFAVAGSKKSYKPQNYDGKFRGPVTLRSALAQSLNIPAVKLLAVAGISDVINLVHKMGITGLNKSSQYYGLALVLGGGEVKLVDMVSAYSVFANEGKYVPQQSILKVIDRDGRVLYEAEETAAVRVFSPEIAYQITNVLSDNVARAPIFGINNFLTLKNRPAAAKSGTTNEYRDGWTLGYTPSLVCGVWTGNNDNHAMKNEWGGSLVWGPIWNDFMTQTLSGTAIEQFRRPAGIKTLRVSTLTGLLPGPYTPTAKQAYEIFAPENIPKKYDTSIMSVEIDSLSGKRANEFTPPEAKITYIYENRHDLRPDLPNWENPVQEWIRKNPTTLTSSGTSVKVVQSPAEIPTETTTLFDASTSSKKTSLNILSPKDNGEAHSGVLDINVSVGTEHTVRKVDFFFDGQLAYTATNAPYHGRITVPKDLALGSVHEISAVVTNEFYNTSRAAIMVTITEDGSKPNISIEGITAQAVLKNGTYPLTIDAQDTGGGIEMVQILLDGNIIGSAAGNSVQTTLTIDQNVSVGPHTLTARARDAHNNIGEVSVPFTKE